MTKYLVLARTFVLLRALLALKSAKSAKKVHKTGLPAKRTSALLARAKCGKTSLRGHFAECEFHTFRCEFMLKMLENEHFQHEIQNIEPVVDFRFLVNFSLIPIFPRGSNVLDFRRLA